MKLNINNKQGIELLHFIFERELKPPFRKGEIDEYGDYRYYNRDNEYIGTLRSDKDFSMSHDHFWINIDDKVCQAFGFSRNTWGRWRIIKPHLKSWFESQLNTRITDII